MNRNQINTKFREIDSANRSKSGGFNAQQRTNSGQAIVTATMPHGSGSINDVTIVGTGVKLHAVACNSVLAKGQIVQWTTVGDGTIRLIGGGGSSSSGSTTAVTLQGDQLYILCGFGTSEP